MINIDSQRGSGAALLFHALMHERNTASGLVF